MGILPVVRRVSFHFVKLLITRTYIAMSEYQTTVCDSL